MDIFLSGVQMRNAEQAETLRNTNARRAGGWRDGSNGWRDGLMGGRVSHLGSLQQMTQHQEKGWRDERMDGENGGGVVGRREEKRKERKHGTKRNIKTGGDKFFWVMQRSIHNKKTKTVSV